ncbi:unnamed protein product [Absidia cylindrospora]
MIYQCFYLHFFRGTARKRRLDVQALMESQQGSVSFKAGKIALESPHRLTASTDPPKIAPAAPHQQNLNQPRPTVHAEQRNLHYHSSENIYSYHHYQSTFYTNQASSIGTRPFPIKDHITATAAHAYPSPPLLPTHTGPSSTDDFPVTLLDEYHLQQQQQQQQQSCTSSASSLSSKASSSYHPSSTSPRCLSDHDMHPITPSATCFYPSDSYSPSLQHHIWGERLPALKAVMSGDTSPSASLLLPCPFENI